MHPRLISEGGRIGLPLARGRGPGAVGGPLEVVDRLEGVCEAPPPTRCSLRLAEPSRAGYGGDPALTMLALRHFKHEEPEAELEPKQSDRGVPAGCLERRSLLGRGEGRRLRLPHHWNGFTTTPTRTSMADDGQAERLRLARIAPDIRMTLLQELREKTIRSSGWSPAPTPARRPSCRRAVRPLSCKEPRC